VNEEEMEVADIKTLQLELSDPKKMLAYSSKYSAGWLNDKVVTISNISPICNLGGNK